MIATTERLSTAARPLYARVWRWHFFAALLVIPFVLWQSVTGTLYVWHEELAQRMYAELIFVTPQPGRVGYAEQLDTVLAHHRGERLAFMRISADPRHSTLFSFSADNDLAHPAFVNPYTGEYLGAVQPTQWLPGLTRSLHGGWPINPYGSYLLELGACWAIVMILTGLYLWWPRGAVGLAGALYPRLRAGSRVFWRDLHSIVGVCFALFVLCFLITALPWTAVWGGQILQPLQRVTGQDAPTAQFFGGTPVGRSNTVSHAGHANTALSQTQARVATLDELIASARSQGAIGDIQVWSLSGTTPINARSRLGRASREVHVKVGLSGEVLAKATWQDYPLLAKLVATGVDLHEGQFFGRANQIFNTLVALALIWLSVTGFMGWYKRRPHGGAGVPPKRALRYPKAMLATGGVLCVALPLLGASVLVLMALDALLGSILSIRPKL